jgi:hypothetical protein
MCSGFLSKSTMSAQGVSNYLRSTCQIAPAHGCSLNTSQHRRGVLNNGAWRFLRAANVRRIDGVKKELTKAIKRYQLVNGYMFRLLPYVTDSCSSTRDEKIRAEEFGTHHRGNG